MKKSVTNLKFRCTHVVNVLYKVQSFLNFSLGYVAEILKATVKIIFITNIF